MSTVTPLFEEKRAEVEAGVTAVDRANELDTELVDLGFSESGLSMEYSNELESAGDSTLEGVRDFMRCEAYGYKPSQHGGAYYCPSSWLIVEVTKSAQLVIDGPWVIKVVVTMPTDDNHDAIASRHGIVAP